MIINLDIRENENHIYGFILVDAVKFKKPLTIVYKHFAEPVFVHSWECLLFWTIMYQILVSLFLAIVQIWKYLSFVSGCFPTIFHIMGMIKKFYYIFHISYSINLIIFCLGIMFLPSFRASSHSLEKTNLR